MSARSFVLHKRRQGNITVNNELMGTAITLHNTRVFLFDRSNNDIVLNSGGWQTVTTKTAINRAFNLFNLPFRVLQVNGKWFIGNYKNDFTIEFYDGMTLNLNEGQILIGV
jgi:hypothetical protein